MPYRIQKHVDRVVVFGVMDNIPTLIKELIDEGTLYLPKRLICFDDDTEIIWSPNSDKYLIVEPPLESCFVRTVDTARVIEVEPLIGKSAIAVCEEAVRLAKEQECYVGFMMGGVRVLVKPTDEPDQVAEPIARASHIGEPGRRVIWRPASAPSPDD